MGYAAGVRNDKIGVYNATETATSGITDAGLTQNALKYGIKN
jgi:hypothetical protein